MDLNYLMDLVNAKVNDDARRAGVMTLGGLRSALAALPTNAPIVTDCGPSLGEAQSYRGYYERLALAPTSDPRTVGDVVAVLDDADGRMFYGYKGGEYDMDSFTFLHFADDGNCGPQIVGVRVEQDRVVIETAEEVSA